MTVVYVLNLPANEAEYEAIRRQLANFPHLSPCRVRGVDGNTLPYAACFPLTKNAWSINHRGTLACFLGHVRAWEMIAASEEPFGLFVEDDVRLTNLDTLKDLNIPEGVDLVFCNDRTNYHIGATERPSFLPLPPAVQYIARHGKAVGGDGYLLTPRGARLLLEFVKEDSFFSHVDLRLFTYGFRDIAEMGDAGGIISQNLRDMRRTYSAGHFLGARILNPSITIHTTDIPSRREAADKPAPKV